MHLKSSSAASVLRPPSCALEHSLSGREVHPISPATLIGLPMVPPGSIHSTKNARNDKRYEFGFRGTTE
jgi:hypothetical protein